ncbi:YesL family protein [Paenibacillus senegalensis]|uniref:YesL family protein n=1 Tax=Paenibacillus senegalensis TaxID=1465766 RepID=UPI00028809A0|nr:DUF624 domain-containing protein [Paenibacillus senegalensis]
MEFRGIMGGFYRISEWIMRLSVINVLWIICSFPFFYLLLILLTSPDFTLDLAQQWLFLMGLVGAFTLVPATGAVFTVARKWVTGDEDVPLFKTFFRGYKENYLQSMLGGLVYLFLLVLLIINYRFYGAQDNIFQMLSFLFITFFFILVGAFFNYMSIMVHFHMKFFQLLKNSFLITIGRPIASIVILLSNFAIVYISISFNFLIPFFMGSLIAIVTFWHFHRGFLKLQEQREKLEQMEAEKEAEEAEKEAEEAAERQGEAQELAEPETESSSSAEERKDR